MEKNQKRHNSSLRLQRMLVRNQTTNLLKRQLTDLNNFARSSTIRKGEDEGISSEELVSISESNQQSSSFAGSNSNINNAPLRGGPTRQISSSLRLTRKNISHDQYEEKVKDQESVNATIELQDNLNKNACAKDFKEIQELNIITQKESVDNFENLMRNSRNGNIQDQHYCVHLDESPKNFDYEQDYTKFLEAVSDANQIPIFDTKQDLMKPHTIERKLKDKFIRDLQKQSKIDNYEINITPILQEILKHDVCDQNLTYYKDILHPRTSARIAMNFKADDESQFSVSMSNSQQKVDDLEHSIISVQVEHYSYNESEQFMIVKTIEEMHDNSNNFNVIHTLRIYKETSNPRLQKSAALLQRQPSHHMEENGESSPDVKMNKQTFKGRISQLFSSKSINLDDANLIESKGVSIPRYKLVKQLIVSDTGPMNKHLDYAKMGKYQQPTSILFYGYSLFYFQKDFKSETMDYTIQRLNLRKVQSDDFKEQIEGVLTKNNQLTNSIQIYWAQESETKGKQLIFTEEELKDLEKVKIDFLQNQFIQIIDQENLQQVLIYSLKHPNRCLSQGIQLPNMKQPLYFNQFFVKRDCQNSKSQLQNILNIDAEGHHRASTCTFLCFYNSCYMSLHLVVDENLSNQCYKNLVYPYTKSVVQNKNVISTDRTQQNALQQFTNDFSEYRLKENNAEVPDAFAHVVKTQINCLQNINVLKYRQNQRINKKENRSASLSYFGHQNAALDSDQEYDEEAILARQQTALEDAQNQYVNMLFFIDENAGVQVVHTQKEFKKMQEQQDGLGEMNDYYRLHIKSKIGHAINQDKQQVKVTYVKNMLTYEDTKFVGKGLIEYFVKADQAFVSKDQQQIYSNYLVAQTDQDQYLYIYKQNNLYSHKENEKVQEEIYNQDFTFDIVKIRHHNYKQKKSRQNEQILRFLQSYSPCQVSQIPQIRINQQYKGLISCWWAINRQSIDKPSEQTQIDLIRDFEKIDKNVTTKYYKLEFQEANIQKMVFETISPPGKYFGINICSQKLIKNLEETHRALNKVARIKFFVVPSTYFVKNNYYYVILELKVFYKSNSQYFFTAENLLVKFKMAKSYEQYNARQGPNDNILGLETMVQFFVNPERIMDTTDQSLKDQINQFELSDPVKLADYNLFKSKLFDYDEEAMEDFSKVRMKSKQKQTLFRFEKIVDSKIQNNFIPFMSYQKDILPLGAVNIFSVCVFNNFMMQALYYVQNGSELHDEKMKVTPSVITNPKKKDRTTILADNQIQLWRCSDYFKSKNGTVVVHYKNTLVFEQMIDRVQIQEFKITFSQKGKMKVYPVARTEKLSSCINSQFYNENLQIIQNKIDYLTESGNKDVDDLIKKRDKYYHHHEYRAAVAVDLQDFNDDGYLGSKDKKKNSPENTDGLVPFNQAYRSPFLQFGYQKQETSNARCFDLVFHARLHDECIINKIFGMYEVYQMFEQIIKTMLKMKPVMIQDFEFLLLNSKKSFEFQMQMQESFFLPQELFIGQSMLDICLNDPSLIANEIQELIRIQQRLKEEDENDLTEDDLQPLYKGSLFDNLTQNNPYTSTIKQKFQLEVDDYLMLSQDFHFKSQLMRCLDSNADNSYKIIIESINKINSASYIALVEHDLFRIMAKNDISEIFKFYEVSDYEELEEMKLGTKNLFCNFEKALIHEDLPAVWNESGLRLLMNRFRDPQNQEEEVVQRLHNMASSFEPVEDVIQVQHKFVDFQKVSLGEKIRQLYEYIVENSQDNKEMETEQLTRFNLEDFQNVFDDLSLAQMMHQEEVNPQFYNLETVQQIVDAQFDKSKKFFSNLFLFYMTTFILPIVIQTIVHNQLVTKICYFTSLISLTLFFVIEVCQMRQLGMLEYLYDFWNIIDSSQFFVFGYLTYIKIFENAHTQEGGDQKLTTIEVYLLVFGLFQSFLKGQSFVRIFDDYGFLVRMIGITVKELYPFIGFYILYIMFFGTAFMILDLEINVTEPRIVNQPSDTSAIKEVPKYKLSTSPIYPGIEKTYAYMLYSFRNSIGDLATPNYDSWLIQRQEGQISQISSYFVVSLVWGIWLFQAMFMVIILLNYLIAVISQAYERVVNQRKIFSYIHKAEINLDYFQIKNQLFRDLKQIKFIVFVEPCKMLIDGDEDDWLGFVHAIQKLIKQNDTNVKARFRKVNETVQEVGMKTNRLIRSQHQEMQNMFKKEIKIDQVKEDIRNLKDEVKDIKSMLGQIMKAVQEPKQRSPEASSQRPDAGFYPVIDENIQDNDQE